MFSPRMAAQRGVRILVAEDSPTQAELLQGLLEEVGYEVTVAVDGHEALAQLALRPPTLIISDIVMPKMDGFSLCREIKANDQWKDIPVILLTTLSDPQDIIHGLQCGADNFITKPYEEEYLLTHIWNILHNIELRKNQRPQTGMEIYFNDQKHLITAERRQILDILLSTFEVATQKNNDLIQARDELRSLNEQLEAKVQERTADLLAEIQERKRVEALLQEQAALLDATQDAILVCDMENRIRYWNRGAEQLYGWNIEESMRQDVEALICKGDTNRRQEACQVVRETGYWAGELKHVTKSGKAVLVESRWTLLKDDSDQPRSLLMVNTDMTERKLLEAQFLRAQRMQSIGTLAGGIAHDLNNMLAPIIMVMQLFRQQFTDERSQHLLRTIETSAQRAAEMVKQVLTFARGLEGERTRIQLKHLISEIVKITRETFPKSIEVDIQTPDEDCQLMGDPTQLHQVLMNLCINARDAMPDGGPLTITAENVVVDEAYARLHIDARVGPYVMITVADTGVGIPPVVADKIFEPFFTSKEVGKGTGLGLSSVLAIVKSHNGFINVYSELGQGSKFTVYLPAEAAAMKVAKQRGTQASLPMGKGELVLVVDDEAAILEITRATLEAYGYQVITAAEGTEAVALYAQHRGEIDVVLTDMMMPILDGQATIRALRKLDPAVQIIAASGLKEPRYATNPADLGVQASLSKPYTAEKLLTTLNLVLAPRRDQHFPIVRPYK